MDMKADIGMVGLAVMGRNMALNMGDHGWTVAAFDRSAEHAARFLAIPAADRERIRVTASPEELAASLSRPRKLMLLIKAGAPVDEMIAQLVPLLEPGDILIDGGNSFHEDTTRRARALAAKGIRYIGMGVSGGEEGARHGPSLMPGGDPEAWPAVREIFLDIAAKTEGGEACCAWMGSEGAGHFVKMVHNGIEYGEMELIAETYHLMRDAMGMGHAAMSRAFADWNRTELDSYLVGITAAILAREDEDGSPLVEKILDSAGQKGTGKWAGLEALASGVDFSLVTEAVFQRFLSSLVEERRAASALLPGPGPGAAGTGGGGGGPVAALGGGAIEELRRALLAAKVISYAQGFMLLRAAGESRGWNLDQGAIALSWRGGCIIRSAMLDWIKAAFDNDPGLRCLLLDPRFAGVMADCQASLRRVVAAAAASGCPAPALSAALSFYDGYRCARLPANLIQAQRDCFGAHQYERIDRPRGELHHGDWIGPDEAAKRGGRDA